MQEQPSNQLTKSSWRREGERGREGEEAGRGGGREGEEAGRGWKGKSSSSMGKY